MMRMYKIFILILAAATFVVNGADVPRPMIRVVNNYKQPIELEIQRVKREVIPGDEVTPGDVATFTADETYIIGVGRDFTIYDLDDLVFVGFKQQESKERFQKLDISGRDRHPDQDLKITISAGLWGWGEWQIERQWIQRSKQSYTYGDIEFEVLDEEPRPKLELPTDAIPLDYEDALEKFITLFSNAKNAGYTLAEITAWYKAFAVMYHPDKVGNKPAQFQALQNAYNSVKRSYPVKSTYSK